MLTTTRPEITDTAVESLHRAAEQLQAHFLSEEGHCYPLEELLGVLVCWMESSIEELADDAAFHAVEGRSDYAFNRGRFEKAMNTLAQRHNYVSS